MANKENREDAPETHELMDPLQQFMAHVLTRLPQEQYHAYLPAFPVGNYCLLLQNNT